MEREIDCRLTLVSVSFAVTAGSANTSINISQILKENLTPKHLSIMRWKCFNSSVNLASLVVTILMKQE